MQRVFFQSPQGNGIVQVGFHSESAWPTQGNLRLRDVGKSDSWSVLDFLVALPPGLTGFQRCPVTLTRAHPDVAPAALSRCPQLSGR